MVNKGNAVSANRPLKRFLKNKMALVSALMIASAAVFTAAAHIYGINPDSQNLTNTFASPSVTALFGTDGLGRDVFIRMIAGARISFLVGITATFISISVGLVYGMTAGYKGGRTDEAMMRIVDVLFGLPFMFFVILLLVFFSRSIFVLFAALGLTTWLPVAVVVRGHTLSVRKMDFVEGAKAEGASDLRIMVNHILPNILPVVIVYATLTVPRVMLQEAFLSFLGLTVRGQEHSWGAILSESVGSVNPIQTHWWLILFPCIFIGAAFLAMNFLGDGLRDAIDPGRSD
ncbi:MAG: ABC transporter permease [Fibrobacterota bacterium]